MTFSIPNEIIQATGMSDAELLQERAVLLFRMEKLTFGQASRLAGMPQLEFQRLLGSRQIPIHYDVADFEADLETLRSLMR
jgi:predicted HTH domain antitoxin